jgi:hypothetical protein
VRPGGGAGGTTDPVNLNGAAGVGVGHVCSQLGTRATVDVGVGRTFDGTVCVDLTNDRTDRRSGSNRIALVGCTIDGDLVDIPVGGHQSREEEREKGGGDHDRSTRAAR